MEERVFSRKCGTCRQRAVAIATVPYTIPIQHDGRTYRVSLPALTVPRCGNCGELHIDHEADRQISEAFHRVAGLLLPEEIRARRQQLGLTQAQLADRLGIAVETLSRWETGMQIQQRSFDRFLQSFFGVAELRAYLERLPAAAPPAA